MKWIELASMVDSAVSEVRESINSKDPVTADSIQRNAALLTMIGLRVQCEIAGSLDSIAADLKAIRKYGIDSRNRD